MLLSRIRVNFYLRSYSAGEGSIFTYDVTQQDKGYFLLTKLISRIREKSYFLLIKLISRIRVKGYFYIRSLLAG